MLNKVNELGGVINYLYLQNNQSSFLYMEILLYIVLGIIGLAIAYVLLKIAAALLGLSLVLGVVSWLIFDNFWLGAILGGIITLIMIIKDPGEYFDDIINTHSGSSSSSKGGTSGSSKRYIHTDEGDVEVYCDTAGGVEDVYGNRWTRQSNGSYRRS